MSIPMHHVLAAHPFCRFYYRRLCTPMPMHCLLALSAQLPPARKLPQCTMPNVCAFCRKIFLHDDAGDRDEVPNTASRQALRRPSPTKLGADTGAAQALRELKAEQRRRGVSTQNKRPRPDKVDQ